MGVTLSYTLVTSSFACCTCFSYCQFICWHEWSDEGTVAALWEVWQKTDFWKL